MCISAPKLDPTSKLYLPYIKSYQGAECSPEHFDDKYVIGQGKYGEVWLSAFTPRTGGKTHLVARKIYYDKPDKELFIRTKECALAAIHHPNVPRLFCVTRDEKGQVGIAMQYVSGIAVDAHGYQKESDLAEWQRYQRAWMSKQWGRVLQAGASLLHLLHAHGLRYNDLKPDNVVVGPHNVWFIDFDMTWRNADIPHRWGGTRTFTAPEMIFLNEKEKGAKIVHFKNEAPDWYKLGLTLYAMLGECRPFPNHDMWSLLQAIKRGIVRERLPEGPVGDLLYGLLRLTSKNRFDHAKVMEWMAAHPEYFPSRSKPSSAEADAAALPSPTD